jgi:hypothetical protein
VFGASVEVCHLYIQRLGKLANRGWACAASGLITGHTALADPRFLGKLHLGKGAAFAPLPEPRYLHPSSLLTVFASIEAH